MAFITEDRIWQLCTNAVEAKTLEGQIMPFTNFE